MSFGINGFNFTKVADCNEMNQPVLHFDFNVHKQATVISDSCTIFLNFIGRPCQLNLILNDIIQIL